MNRWILYVVMLTLVAGCGQQIEPGRTAADAPALHGLGLQTVQPASLAREESFVGTVQSPDRGILSARIDGRVAEMPVAEGARVTAGQLLLVLADQQAGDRLEEAQGGVAAARSGLAAARSGLELAQKTRDRYARLMANQAVTPQEMDEIEGRLEQARQQVQGAAAGLTRAEAAAAAARRAVAWTRVTAPDPARVVRHQVAVGTTVMPGTPLLTLDREGTWQVRATVPESRIGRLKVGQQLAVEVPAAALRLTGALREIVPATDPQSRSFEIKIDLPVDPALAAGLFARVYAPTAERTALLVPAAAVIERGQLHGLYVVEDGRLHFRLVRLGRRVDQRVEILSGLEAGTTIVVGGVERAKDGARVEG